MAKDGEINYLKNLDDNGIIEAINKPFSNYHCGQSLMEIGAIFSLLPSPPAKLLDLGCGTGWTSCFFAKRGYDVVGQDIAEDMIYHANNNKEKEKIENLKFVVSDYENLNYINEFDCAVFYSALHHAENEKEAIFKVYNALKPGGICIVSEPGFGHDKKASTIDAVKKFDVTEKSMPPGRVIKMGKEVGFKSFEIYPHAHHYEILIYNKLNLDSYFQILLGNNFFEQLHQFL